MLGETWWAIAYTGIISVAVGYTLQAHAQRIAPPTDAALILSTESVFAAIAGYIMLGENLQPTQVIGCVFIFAAVLVAQAPWLVGGSRYKAPAVESVD